MSFLRFSVTHKRNSLISLKRPYQPLLNKKESNTLPKLITNSSERFNDINIKNEKCNIKSRCSAKIYNGEPLIDNDMPKVQFFSAFNNVYKSEFNVTSLYPLPSPNDTSFHSLFKEKISICNIIFNFMDAQSQISGKREKTQSLRELNALLSESVEVSMLNEHETDMLYEMIMNNIFSQDPFASFKKIFSSSIKLSFAECSWEHLSLSFQILNQYVLLFPEKCQIDIVKKAICLMNIPDSNERDNLVVFLQNYSKVKKDQFDEIWKEIKNALVNVRYNIYTFYCVDPLISFMASFSNSNLFCTKYFINVLYSHILPLFDNQNLPVFFNKLSTLLIQIVENNYDDKLKVIEYLLKHFPIQCGQKQPLFVAMLISITNTMDVDQLNPISNKIFAFLAMSLQLPNSKLAESALSFLMKPNLRPIIFRNYENAIEILYEPLKIASYYYWEKSIKDHSAVTLSTLTNAKLEFQKNIALSDFVSSEDLTDIKNMDKNDGKDLAKTWGLVARTAAKRDREIDLTKSLFNIQKQFKKEEKRVSDDSSDHVNNRSSSSILQSIKGSRRSFF